MQNIENHVLPPLLNPRTNPPPPLFFKNLLRLKIIILSSVYPEINFPAEQYKLSVPTKSASPSPSESNGRPLKCIAGSIQIYVNVAVKGKYKTKQTNFPNKQNGTEFNIESEDL